jgi:hypothetical protein
VDGDGKVRLILSHDDPGFHNWMDTQGFESGNVTYRILLSESRATLRTQVVKRADLASVLPLDSVKVSPEQRAQQLRERFDGIRQRYRL